jgi:N-acetyl-anhydromuramyl-L-alanine amidase AmpD
MEYPCRNILLTNLAHAHQRISTSISIASVRVSDVYSVALTIPSLISSLKKVPISGHDMIWRLGKTLKPSSCKERAWGAKYDGTCVGKEAVIV